jgi:hypothetical protein
MAPAGKCSWRRCARMGASIAARRGEDDSDREVVLPPSQNELRTRQDLRPVREIGIVQGDRLLIDADHHSGVATCLFPREDSPRKEEESSRQPRITRITRIARITRDLLFFHAIRVIRGCLLLLSCVPFVVNPLALPPPARVPCAA